MRQQNDTTPTTFLETIHSPWPSRPPLRQAHPRRETSAPISSPAERPQRGSFMFQPPPTTSIRVPMAPLATHSSVTPTPDAVSGPFHDASSSLDPVGASAHTPPMTRTLAHYTRHEQIGQGTYGHVYRATCLDTQQIVALKKVRIHHGSYWGMPQQLVREIKILKRLRHENILRLFEVVTSKGVEYLDPPETNAGSASAVSSGAANKDLEGGGNLILEATQASSSIKKQTGQRDSTMDVRESYKGNLFLVLEYVPHDLTGLMDVAYQFSPLQVKIIFKQLLQAVAYMHEQKYIHRDLKSSNILLHDDLRLKLADFGLARCIEPPVLDQLQDRTGTSSLDLTNKVITLWYRPPEILLGAVEYGPPVDVFSAGCILAELLLGKPLFCGKTEIEQFQLLVDMLGTPSLETWNYLQSLKKTNPRSESGGTSSSFPTLDMGRPKPSRLREKYEHKMSTVALNLLEKLLDWDPRKRLTATSALTHRYFWSEPAVPANPAAWERIHVPGGHFHEFQTKKKRKQAKAQAEKAKEDALLKGLSEEEAKAVQDEKYLSLMRMVAEVGYDAFDKSGPTQPSLEEASSSHGDRDEKDRKRRESRSRSYRDEDDHERRRRKRSGEHKRHRETSEERRLRRKEARSHKYQEEKANDSVKMVLEESNSAGAVTAFSTTLATNMDQERASSQPLESSERDSLPQNYPKEDYKPAVPDVQRNIVEDHYKQRRPDNRFGPESHARWTEPAPPIARSSRLINDRYYGSAGPPEEPRRSHPMDRPPAGEYDRYPGPPEREIRRSLSPPRRRHEGDEYHAPGRYRETAPYRDPEVDSDRRRRHLDHELGSRDRSERSSRHGERERYDDRSSRDMADGRRRNEHDRDSRRSHRRDDRNVPFDQERERHSRRSPERRDRDRGHDSRRPDDYGYNSRAYDERRGGRDEDRHRDRHRDRDSGRRWDRDHHGRSHGDDRRR